MKAIIEGLGAHPGGQPARRIRLLVGARRRPDRYDLPDLSRLEAACAQLEVVTALSDDPAAGSAPERARTALTQTFRHFVTQAPSCTS